MKLVNYLFKTTEDLETFIDLHFVEQEDILIQLFCGIQEVSKIQSVLDLLAKKLPKASIIGASTAGEISDGFIYEETIQISFSIFQHSKIRTRHLPKADFASGVKTASEFVKKDTKVIIAFSEGLKGDSELFLEGFSSLEHNIPIVGGNAADNTKFAKTLIVLNDKIYDDGIVLCAIDSDHLHVSTNYSLEWTEIAKEMVVTKALNNVIYEIDNTPVDEIYTHYLGDEILDDFPNTVIEFPLIKTDDTLKVARSIIGKTEDKGFTYAGHFQNGDRVKFAIGNVEQVLNQAKNLYEKILASPVEATYIYSCSVRKKFLQQQLNYEFSLIQEIAPTCGFFTYGEFYHNQTNNQLLNITTTTLSLSESDVLHVSKDVKFLTHKSSMLKSLTHLVNISQDDLNISINNLNQYKLILDNSSIVSKADLKGNITYVNDEFCKVSGYTREELVGKKHSIVKHPDTSDQVFQKMWKTITSKNIWSSTIKNCKKNGESYYVKTVIMPLLDESGEISEYIASRTDVTELIKKDKLIKEQFEDELTGLHSRGALLHDLLIEPDSYASLILINIDRFSDINDYFGYETGDELLRAFAKKLQNGHQKAYRISGDEFALLCEHELKDKNRDEIASMLIDLETSEYRLFEESISIFLSCGVSYSKKRELYKLSHIALKKNKFSNEPVTYYNDFKDLEDKIKENLDVILRIKEGLKHDRFVPFYQGIVDNKTKKIVKYEALIRLKCDDGRVESPFFFLEHAKRSKLYTKLTKVMILKTFEKFADLEYEFSINLLLQDIESPKVMKCLIDNLEKYQCGKRVVLEIVESEGIYNFDLVSQFINLVKSYGCKIAIDDFGTGYSNFSYLAKLDIDYIKIDGSLVKDIDKDLVQMATVESILHFARKVGIKTIAEYVENEIIYNHLYDLGVDFSQGYYFSKPQEELL